MFRLLFLIIRVQPVVQKTYDCQAFIRVKTGFCVVSYPNYLARLKDGPGM